MDEEIDKLYIEDLTEEEESNDPLEYYKWIIQEDIEDDKVIRRIEAKVRHSLEYKDLIKTIKKSGINQCQILQDEDLSVELHHTVFTLYDITKAHLSKMINESKDNRVSYFEITDDILRAHYTGDVMLTAVCVTIHELIHLGHIKLAKQDVGCAKKWYETYQNFLPANKKIAFNDFLKSDEVFVQAENEKFLKLYFEKEEDE